MVPPFHRCCIRSSAAPDDFIIAAKFITTLSCIIRAAFKVEVSKPSPGGTSDVAALRMRDAKSRGNLDASLAAGREILADPIRALGVPGGDTGAAAARCGGIVAAAGQNRCRRVPRFPLACR
jgi:phage-related tail protein